MLMFGNLSVFLSIVFLIFRNVPSDIVGSFAKIVMQVAVSSFRHRSVFRFKIACVAASLGKTYLYLASALDERNALISPTSAMMPSAI